MKTLSGFPCFEVQFDKQGEVHDSREVTQLLNFLNQEPVTDLVVISHGWNNHMDEARDLYRRFFTSFRNVLDLNIVPNTSNRQFAILAVLWPSKKFADQELIPSGAAGAGASVSNSDIREQIDSLMEVFDTTDENTALKNARKLVAKLEDSPSAQRKFVDLVRSVLSKDAADEEDGSVDFFKLNGNILLKQLSKPILPGSGPKSGSGGGAASIGAASSTGVTAGLEQFFGGIKGAAKQFLNYTTYYLMKSRSGIVGRKGLNFVLQQICQQDANIKLQLVGHSFGGRLITSAVSGPKDQPALKINTLTLLQAAFSHYGFAHKFDGNHDGFFRNVIAGHTVSGPIIISCTANDKAVGIAYPIASRLANQVGAGFGDKNDLYGGIGRNGAQKTPEAIDAKLLALDGSSYQFQSGQIYNLNSDHFIQNHGDISKEEVAYAMLSAISMI